MRIEEVILSALANDAEFIRKAGPHIQEEYFANESEQVVFALLDRFIKKYNKKPARDSIMVEFEGLDGLSEDGYSECKQILKDAFADQYQYEHEWLMEEAEKFCQDKALYNQIMESVKIYNGEHKTLERGSIPSLMTQALAVAFDKKLGHDYFNDAEARYDYYHDKLDRIPTEIEILNRVTGGGFPRKTLCVYAAPSNVGKSAVLAAHAAFWLSQGKNVAVFTLELSEEEWTKRIDANRFGMPMNDLGDVPKPIFMKKIDQIKSKTQGRLKVKEYAPGAAGVIEFGMMLDEWKLKEDFVADIIIVDYIGICKSSRLKLGNSVNTNTYLKSVSEEVRGMAIERNALAMSAAQTNRNGFDNTEPTEKDIADSIGIIQTADWVANLISTEELRELNQIVMKMLKTRFGDKKITKWVAGFDFPKMTLYDVEQIGQTAQARQPEEDKRNSPSKRVQEKTDGKFNGFKFD